MLRSAVLGLLGLLLVGSACSSTSVADTPCVHGTIEPCTGDSGCDGERVCGDDGKYRECICNETDGGAGSGGSAGAGGMSGAAGAGGTAGAGTGGSSGAAGMGGMGGMLNTPCKVDFDTNGEGDCFTTFSNGVQMAAPSGCGSGNAWAIFGNAQIQFSVPFQIGSVRAKYKHEGQPASISYLSGASEVLGGAAKSSVACSDPGDGELTQNASPGTGISTIVISVPTGSTLYVDDLEIFP